MDQSDDDRRRAAPWLFEAFPALRARVPWTPLVAAPTPVERLERVSGELGAEVWIKRDDLTSPVYGGNKPRKLEFLLGAALSQGRKTVVTGGGLGTNHGLATTIFGRQLGFRVALGLFDQPVTDHVRRNLRLFHAYGAEMLYCGSLSRALLHYYVIQRVRRPTAYFIPAGGSNAVGALGFVDAGLELARQVERKELPAPRAIYVATGTCGTLAGLVVGLKLAGLATRVVGVQVAAPLFANPKAALLLARKTLRLLRRHDAAVPDVALGLDDFRLDTDHFGPGYGHPTESARAAMALMRDCEGITLDLTYTGKAFGALVDHARAGLLTGPVLFWNTFNSVDLSPVADSVDYRALPQPFHRFFEGDLRRQ